MTLIAGVSSRSFCFSEEGLGLGLFDLQRKEAHLDMIEGVVVDCLRAKWKAFIQARLPVTSYKSSS